MFSDVFYLTLSNAMLHMDKQIVDLSVHVLRTTTRK